MSARASRIATMPAMALFFVLLSGTLFIAEVHAQTPILPVGTTSAASSTTANAGSTTASASEPTASSISTGSVSATTSTFTVPATSTSVLLPTQPTPGPAKNPFEPGTVNCLDKPYCGANEECFVLEDGLVCLEKTMNWGYILARNNSGIPSVPSWSGPRSQLNTNCTRFQMPKSSDKPGLALMVYDLIQGTLPRDLLLSRFDQATTIWYTMFSNCEPDLACMMGECQLRPTLNQSCTSSWQCNPQALGLDENNSPIATANVTGIRCEYEDGNLSVNKTCQLLHREAASNSGSGFSAWQVILPIVGLLALAYFGTVFYQRRMRRQKLRKWSRVMEDDRNEFQMQPYDDLR